MNIGWTHAFMMFISVYNEPSFSLHKILLMDWSRVDYLWIIVMFLSTLILTAPIHSGYTGEHVM